MYRRYYEGDLTLRLGYDFYADIAERIVKKRRAFGMTQEQLSVKSKVPLNRIIRYEGVKIRCSLGDLENLANALDTSVDCLIGAEYDDPDLQKCLYAVWNERLGSENGKFALYIKASSPQMAFLLAYKWSLDVKCIWFEARDRALVRLEGVPVRKADYEGCFKERKPGHEDEIEVSES